MDHAVLEHVEALAGMRGCQNLRLALGEVEQLLEVGQKVARLLQDRHEGRVLEHVARLLAVEDARKVLRDGVDVEVPFAATGEEAVDLAARIGAVEQELELVDNEPGSPSGAAVCRDADPDMIEDDEKRQRLELAGQFMQIEAHEVRLEVHVRRVVEQGQRARDVAANEFRQVSGVAHIGALLGHQEVIDILKCRQVLRARVVQVSVIRVGRGGIEHVCLGVIDTARHHAHKRLDEGHLRRNRGGLRLRVVRAVGKGDVEGVDVVAGVLRDTDHLAAEILGGGDVLALWVDCDHVVVRMLQVHGDDAGDFRIE